MAVDYAEKEREFLESLAADTGRDLSGWMTAISATSLTDRNAIIDWLRQQGFLFARASWLERIYHNGGRPIYLDPAAFETSRPPRDKPQLAPPIVPAKTAAPVLTPEVLPTPRPHLAPVPNDAIAQARPPQPARSETASLDALLAEAKAYRPLAQFVLREIEKIAPTLVFEARSGFVAINGPYGLAGVLTIAPRELRLAIAWPADAAPAPFVRAKFAKTHPDIPAQISHMAILTDARQVTPDLVGAVAKAAGRS
ncbi:MAG: hypothetical protein K2Q28_15290 [Hyphomicrobium sp.]|nr:hypothetical protein [Hyphomicrobium sp.]